MLWPPAAPTWVLQARSLRQSVDVTRLSRIALTNLEREGDGSDYTAAEVRPGDIRIDNADAELDFDEQRDDGARAYGGGGGRGEGHQRLRVTLAEPTPHRGKLALFCLLFATLVGPGGVLVLSAGVAEDEEPASPAHQAQDEGVEGSMHSADSHTRVAPLGGMVMAAGGAAGAAGDSLKAGGTQGPGGRSTRGGGADGAAGGRGARTTAEAEDTAMAGARAWCAFALGAMACPLCRVQRRDGGMRLPCGGCLPVHTCADARLMDGLVGVSSGPLGSEGARGDLGGLEPGAGGGGAGGAAQPSVEALVWHTSDSAVKPIVANRRIEKLPEPKFDIKALPFAPMSLQVGTWHAWGGGACCAARSAHRFFLPPGCVRACSGHAGGRAAGPGELPDGHLPRHCQRRAAQGQGARAAAAGERRGEGATAGRLGPLVGSVACSACGWPVAAPRSAGAHSSLGGTVRLTGWVVCARAVRCACCAQVNVLSYFETLCMDTNAANVLINSSLTILFIRMLRNARAPTLRIRLASVLGLLVRHATYIAEELAQTGVMEILTEALRDKNERVRCATPAMARFLSRRQG